MLDNSQHPHPCGKCTHYSDSVWQPVAAGDMSVLSRGFFRKDLEPGQILFEQDGESRGLFCVSRGLIALRTLHEDGKSTLLRLAYPGEIIGVRSFLRNGRHMTEARAVVPSRVCTVARRDANQVVRASPPVLARLAERCLTEIDETHARIIASATKANKQRLAELLACLMENHGEKSGEHMHMHLPLSRTDLADLIGVQPETLSRLVKRLEADGNFLISGRKVTANLVS